MASGRIIWNIPAQWHAPSLCDRTALYPALYLRSLGFRTSVTRTLSPDELAGASALVMVTDGALSESERGLVRSAEARSLPLIFCPQNGIAKSDRDLIASSGAVALQADGDPHASPPPKNTILRTFTVPICGAHAAEDAVLAGELRTSTRSRAAETRLKGERYLAIGAEDPDSLLQVRPLIEKWTEKLKLRVIVVADESLFAELPVSLTEPVAMSVRDAGLLEIIAGAEVFVSLHSSADQASPRPGQWVRTALQEGVPVVASSHPSIDGMAGLCICDDIERGLALYLGSSFERAKAAVQAHTKLLDHDRPNQVARRWAKLLQKPKSAAREPRQEGAPTEGQNGLLVSLLDLPQDIDLILPILVATRERGALRQRILVTDWLEHESPRTLSALSDAGFRPEIVSRAAARKGEFPGLLEADAVLSACESTASPHKIGHAFARKADSLGLASFTVQHGYENVGLNYKDQELGPEIRFGSETVFVWFPKSALPGWVSDETRTRLVHVGCPKFPPPLASKLPPFDRRWLRVVGVFENLHWRRYDEAFRRSLLSDLDQTAAVNPNVLFLVKPHHAGRWFHMNRGELQDRANVLIVDPTDANWQPYTAPELIASLDAVLTTPSTVAIDAARVGKPVAVLGYDLDLPLYAPLPIVRGTRDWLDFLAAADGGHSWCNEAFLSRALLPGRADRRIASYIENAIERRRLMAAA